jgi:hypothetical protein
MTRTATYRLRGDDFHETPLVAISALMSAETLPRTIWEPACGRGAIVTPLRDAGHLVTATDLVDRGCQDARSGVDFLMWLEDPPAVEGIVTNPPYKLAQAFCERATRYVPYVAMLLPLAFLESEVRQSWFRASTLAAVYVFSRRLPMMHRDGWTGPIASSNRAYAWFVWDERNMRAEPVIRWL